MTEVMGIISTVAPVLPLVLQIAANIVGVYSVLLVKNQETGSLVPYYYDQDHYVADIKFDRIRSFIQKEVIDMFNYYRTPSLFDNNGAATKRLAGYSVSADDYEAFGKKPSYINSIISNVVQHIKNMGHIIRDESEFDNNPYTINCENGIFDIRCRTLKPHNPADLSRKIIHASYLNTFRNKGDDKRKIVIRRAPIVFLHFIRDSLYDISLNDTENQKVVDSFLQLLASFFIGNNIQKLIYVLVGKPNTGKSTLLNVLGKIFGEYKETLNNSAVMVSSRTSNDIRPDILTLQGKRLIATSETNKMDKFDTALLKQLAGNDEVSFRKPHKGEMIKVKLVGKIMLVTNFCPTFSNLDDAAFLNRILIVDFNNIPEKIDPDLENKLLTERDAIFTYLIDIAHKLASHESSISIADRFKANKQRIMVNQNNSVALFWKAHIRPMDDYTVPENLMNKHPIKLLYSVMYLDFCKRIEITPLAFEAFAKDFKALSDQFDMVTWKKGASNNFYLGMDVEGGKQDRYYQLINRDYIFSGN